MFEVLFKPSFIRALSTLHENARDEAIEKIDLLKDRKNHRQLRVHKLHGRLSGCFSFSVNYRTRIVFAYESKTEIVLLAIGDHSIYN